jgi:hypothetical protein
VNSEKHGNDTIGTQGKPDSCGEVGDSEMSGKPRVSVGQASTVTAGMCFSSTWTLPNIYEGTAVDKVAEGIELGDGKRSAERYSDRWLCTRHVCEF